MLTALSDTPKFNQLQKNHKGEREMTNLKNEGTKTMTMKIQLFKGWSILLGLVLVATTAGAALAYNGDAKGHTFDDTFTKWVTTSKPAEGVLANMVGIVGGDVGPGTYTGEVISVNTVGNITSIQALYHFNGSKHAFTADLNVTQDESAGTATITGHITDGWLKGASVTGEYNVLAVCPMVTPDNAYGTVCFQGVLHVHAPK
jgi:hypothetical protein